MPNKVLICTHYRHNPRQPSCAARGSLAILKQLQIHIESAQLAVHIETIQCLGNCQQGVNVRIVGGKFFQHVTIQDIPIIIEHLQYATNTDS